MEIISRSEAKRQGLSLYLGVPCKYGHEGWRVKSGHCKSCVELDRSQPAKRKMAKEQASNWYQNNKVRAAERQKNYRKLNPGYDQESKKAWKLRNPDKVKSDTARRRAAKINRTPPWADLKEIQIFYGNCPEGYHVDHYYPLQGETVSGLHVLENLQYLPAEENISKRNSMPSRPFREHKELYK